MTDAEKLAYGRGYNAGARGYWPAHKPPAPPEPVVAGLVAALQDLRDHVDTLLAQLDPEDEWERLLGPNVDAADAALAAVTAWLKEGSA